MSTSLCKHTLSNEVCRNQLLTKPAGSYHIPGDNGSLQEGDGLLNLCWYSNVPPGSLIDFTTDCEGKCHHTTVPTGKVRPDLCHRQCQRGTLLLPEPYKEVLNELSQPFLQVITDYCSPRASFAEGKVLLVGEALTLFRPHIAFSTNQAAFDCRMVGQLLGGAMSLQEWEGQVVKFGRLHWRRSIWFGEWFQRPLYLSMWARVRYWLDLGVDSWWQWRRGMTSQSDGRLRLKHV